MRRHRALRVPPPTVRARLSVLYGGVFLVTGLILLSVSYVFVRDNLNRRVELQHLLGIGRPHRPIEAIKLAVYEGMRAQWIHQTLHQLVWVYALALIAVTAVSVVAGWLLAGRALAPLRRITATAQRVSSENLGERIALAGPEDELKQLADTIDGMLTRLDGAFASQRHFVANASHELRTPLAIMRTEVDVALADPDASVDDLRDMGEALRESIDRSEGLIAALLALARAEAIGSEERSVELDVLAGDCITDLSRRANDAGVHIDIEALAPAIVQGDPALLERLLANLIDNGIRHNVPGGYLRLSTTAQGDQVELIAANGGPVITPEQVASLTEPFRRLSRQTAGYGLGLSIVKSVVAAHGGELFVSAPESGGLEVRVHLTRAGNSRGGRGHVSGAALKRLPH